MKVKMIAVALVLAVVGCEKTVVPTEASLREHVKDSVYAFEANLKKKFGSCSALIDHIQIDKTDDVVNPYHGVVKTSYLTTDQFKQQTMLKVEDKFVWLTEDKRWKALESSHDAKLFN